MKSLNKSNLQEVKGIFFCAVFCVYSWLLLIFFWDLPAFLFYLSVGDIIGYIAYQFVFALGESIVVTFFIATLILIIPGKHIKSNIAIIGSLLIFSFAIVSIIFKELGEIAKWLMRIFSINGFIAAQISIGTGVFAMLALPILSIALANKNKVTRLIKNFIENLYVLAVLYMILSILGIAIVIYRNMK